MQPTDLRAPEFNDAVRVVNTSGEVVPPFAVMRVVSTTVVGGTITHSIAKPNSTFQRMYLVNGPISIAAHSGAEGLAKWLTSGGFVMYESGSPTVGQSWGAKSGQWSLSQHRPGFLIKGGTATYGNPVVAAVQEIVTSLLGKTTTTHTIDTAQTVDIYVGAVGSETTSGMSLSARNCFATVPDDRFVTVQYLNGQPYLTAARCSA